MSKIWWSHSTCDHYGFETPNLIHVAMLRIYLPRQKLFLPGHWKNRQKLWCSYFISSIIASSHRQCGQDSLCWRCEHNCRQRQFCLAWHRGRLFLIIYASHFFLITKKNKPKLKKGFQFLLKCVRVVNRTVQSWTAKGIESAEQQHSSSSVEA